MASPTFYHPELCREDSTAALSAGESSHATKSRRLRIGQQVNLINGKGLKAQCCIVDNIRNRVTLRIESVQQIVRPKKSLTIATAIPKGDRQRMMIDSLTQQGVSRVIALHCEYSVSRFSDKLQDKWQRYAIESCKQSQNLWLPDMQHIASVPALLEWLNRQTNTQAVYADAAGVVFSKGHSISDHMVILIGPEGGFSPSEIKCLEDATLPRLKLANDILRIETAAISAAAQHFRS